MKETEVVTLRKAACVELHRAGFSVEQLKKIFDLRQTRIYEYLGGIKNSRDSREAAIEFGCTTTTRARGGETRQSDSMKSKVDNIKRMAQCGKFNPAEIADACGVSLDFVLKHWK